MRFILPKIIALVDRCRDVPMGDGASRRRAPNIIKFAGKLVKKVSQTARGLATIFSVTFIF